MKKVILLSIFLTGCAFKQPVPITSSFPDAPVILKEKCPDLHTVEGDKVAITELLKAVVKNYQLYYECSLKNEGWNKWYNEQKKIYETVK